MKCSQFKSCPPKAKVSKSYDVGGAYGQSSEKRMMKEILRNGVLNTEFQAPNVFATYKDGLITSDSIQTLSQLALKKQQNSQNKATDISDQTINDKGMAW